VEHVVKEAQQTQHDYGAKDQTHVEVLAAARALQAWLWIAAQQLNDSVVGLDAVDVLVGLDAVDVLVGLDAVDVLVGLDAVDVLVGLDAVDVLVGAAVGADDGGTSGLRDESILQRRGGEVTQLGVRRMIGHGSGLDGLDLEYQRAEGMRAKAGLRLMCECFGGVFQGAAELEGVSCGI
jgi:Ca2+-binding RTX toxin-like protein